MSGHVSELSACGLRIDVVTKLTELINQAQSEKVFSEDDVFGTFYFLATNGSYKATGFAMTGKAKGWSEGNASRKILSESASGDRKNLIGSEEIGKILSDLLPTKL